MLGAIFGRVLLDEIQARLSSGVSIFVALYILMASFPLAVNTIAQVPYRR